MSGTERTGIQRPGEAAQGVSGGLIERGEDDRLSLRRLLVPAGAIAISLLYILGGLVWRQLYQSDYYDDKFEFQSSRRIQIPAPRGHIYDRNGKLIVRNRPRYNIVADLSNPVLRDKVHKTYLTIYRDARRRFENGTSKNRPNTAALMENARLTVLQNYLDKILRVMPGHKEKVNAAEIKKHLSLKRGLNFPLLNDVAVEEVAVFIENFPEVYPLQLYVDSVRYYEFGDSAAHVLGYLSDTDELGEDPDEDPHISELRKLKYTGKTGVAGLELSCNEQLQGKPGSQVWRVSPNGYLDKKLSETKAEQGAHIYCSLDIDLQKAAEDALAAAKEDSALTGQYKGAAVAIDIGTGEILAMASYPRFDPNKFADKLSFEYHAWMKQSGSEYNLATQGLYPPGSTFKVVTAIAGMRAGKLDPDETFSCASTVEAAGRLWKEHDGKSFGEVDMIKMLRVSCNAYCWQLGQRLAASDVSDEAKRLGLGSKIIIEPRLSDRTGAISTVGNVIVPDLAWKRKTGRSSTWSLGETLNMVIGQGDLRITPLHMARMIASVGANRTNTNLSLLHDPAQDGLNLTNKIHKAESLGLAQHQRARLLDGLRACVQSDEPGSTGKPVRVPGLDIVGKTGTAEFKDTEKRDVNLAWFEGFAPGNNPRIAVVVMIEGEHGGVRIHGGQHAGPVAKAIFAKWQAQQAKLAEKAAGTPAQ